MNQTQPITLLVCALGGEGGGVLTEWLIEAARLADHAAQSTSIPGVAQRTGATTYYLEVFPLPMSELGGRRPVFSLSPVPGALDAIISSELLETVRQIGNGMSTAERTLVISSSARSLTTAERMVPGDGRADARRLLEVVKAFSREHHVLDMSALAREAGTIVSAVMLGALAASGLLPFAREHYERAVRGKEDARAPSRSMQANLRGFAMAFEALSQPRAQAALVHQLRSDGDGQPTPSAPDLPDPLRAMFPPPVHDMLALGHARVLDYQDADYAADYAKRLSLVLAAERAADPGGIHGWGTTREMARWLALWMAFDDIVRVADLKSRASRTQRVRSEVKAAADDLLKVYDHFKPGAPEFAALLPGTLAARITAWDRRRQAAGKAPWALPLKVGSHSVSGMLSLRLLASLRWLRRRGSRFGEEQALMQRWLDAVLAGTASSWQLGHEIALCGRLIKGYGSTNERGKRNLLHVIEHLALAPLPDGSPAARAAAIAAAREAALADEGGSALDAALLQHGAPARPIVAQPIRWMKRPPHEAGHAHSR